MPEVLGVDDLASREPTFLLEPQQLRGGTKAAVIDHCGTSRLPPITAIGITDRMEQQRKFIPLPTRSEE